MGRQPNQTEAAVLLSFFGSFLRLWELLTQVESISVLAGQIKILWSNVSAPAPHLRLKLLPKREHGQEMAQTEKEDFVLHEFYIGRAHL